MKLATSFQRSDSPPWLRRGGRDIKKMPRSLLVRSGRGGLFHYRLIGGLDEPPRLRPLRRLRIFLLVAQPPRLGQGGEFACSKRTRIILDRSASEEGALRRFLARRARSLLRRRDKYERTFQTRTAELLGFRLIPAFGALLFSDWLRRSFGSDFQQQ